MPRSKREGYEDKLINFKVPASLGEKIDAFIKKHPKDGFRNRTDFLIWLIRKETNEIREKEESKSSED